MQTTEYYSLQKETMSEAMRTLDATLSVYYKVKKPFLKGYIMNDSNYMTFQKRNTTEKVKDQYMSGQGWDKYVNLWQ